MKYKNYLFTKWRTCITYKNPLVKVIHSTFASPPQSSSNRNLILKWWDRELFTQYRSKHLTDVYILQLPSLVWGSREEKSSGLWHISSVKVTNQHERWSPAARPADKGQCSLWYASKSPTHASFSHLRTHPYFGLFLHRVISCSVTSYLAVSGCLPLC